MEWTFDSRDAGAARRTRSGFVDYLRAEFGANVDHTGAELVLGELMGNVARHAPGPAHVEAETTDHAVSIEVTDRGVGFRPQPRADIDPMSERGRGLAIVSRLADDVTVDCNGGCHVRARVPLGTR